MRLRAMMIFAAVCLSVAVCTGQTKSQSTIVQGQSTVTFSATPVFNANLANAFKLTLTGNVTSSTLTNADAGQLVQFEICQDGTGGRTFVAPTNVLNMGTIAATAGACSTQEFLFDGSNAVALGPMESAGGILISSANFNNAATGTGAALTVGGTSSTTGGLSIFVGAPGASVERLSVLPADGTSAAVRIGSLSVRTPSLGFLTGTEVAKIDTSGNLNLSGGADTLEQASAFGGATGHAGLWANSITHLWAAKNNNGSAYNLVGDTTSQALTNKTLGGTTPYNRIRANQGTALVAGDFALSAGWGTTASVGSVLGTDSAFSFVVTSSGTGQGVGPTVTITFHDGTWTNSPLCVANMGPGNSGLTAWLISSVSATQLVLQGTLVSGNFTPIAANTYGGTVICVGR
jgi:hypothetical protein